MNDEQNQQPWPIGQFVPVDPEEHDSMPADVALEMLINPKNKLSARMRKNCFAAREKVFVSKHPIRRICFFDTPDVDNLCWDTEIMAKPGKQKLEEKLSTTPWDRLNRLVKRMENRIARVNAAIARAKRTIKVPWIFNSLKNDFGNRIAGMEMAKQIAVGVINNRKLYGNK